MQRWFERLQPLFLILALAFVVLLLRSQWPALRAHPWQFHGGWLALSGLLMVGAWLMEVGIWHQLLRVVGGVVPSGCVPFAGDSKQGPQSSSSAIPPMWYAPIPYWAALRMWFLAALIRYIPGNIWQPLSLTLYCQQWGVRPEATIASVALYQAVVLLAIVPIAVIYFGVTGNWGLLSGFMQGIAPWLLGLGSLPLLIFLLRPGWLLDLLNWALRKIGRDAIAGELTTGQLFKLMMIGLVDWLLWGASFAALGLALGRPATLSVESFVLHLTAVYPIAYAIGFLSFLAPSGFGVREGTFYLLLTPLLDGGYVTALALAMRLWNILGEAAMALLTVLANRIWPLSPTVQQTNTQPIPTQSATTPTVEAPLQQ